VHLNKYELRTDLCLLSGEGTCSYSGTVQEDELFPAGQTDLPGNASIVHE